MTTTPKKCFHVIYVGQVNFGHALLREIQMSLSRADSYSIVSATCYSSTDHVPSCLLPDTVLLVDDLIVVPQETNKDNLGIDFIEPYRNGDIAVYAVVGGLYHKTTIWIGDGQGEEFESIRRGGPNWLPLFVTKIHNAIVQALQMQSSP